MEDVYIGYVVKIKCNFVSGTAGSAAWELEL